MANEMRVQLMLAICILDKVEEYMKCNLTLLCSWDLLSMWLSLFPTTGLFTTLLFVLSSMSGFRIVYEGWTICCHNAVFFDFSKAVFDFFKAVSSLRVSGQFSALSSFNLSTSQKEDFN